MSSKISTLAAGLLGNALKWFGFYPKNNLLLL
jgi:hypothetical protein